MPPPKLGACMSGTRHTLAARRSSGEPSQAAPPAHRVGLAYRAACAPSSGAVWLRIGPSTRRGHFFARCAHTAYGAHRRRRSLPLVEQPRDGLEKPTNINRFRDISSKAAPETFLAFVGECVCGERCHDLLCSVW